MKFPSERDRFLFYAYQNKLQEVLSSLPDSARDLPPEKLVREVRKRLKATEPPENQKYLWGIIAKVSLSAEPETEEEAVDRDLLLALAAPKKREKEEDPFLKVYTGLLSNYFSGQRPKKKSEMTLETREGINLLRLSRKPYPLNKDLLQYIDFTEEVDKVLSKNITCQKLWYLAVSEAIRTGLPEREGEAKDVYISQSDFMKICGLSDRISAEKDLKEALLALGSHRFIITTKRNPNSKRESLSVRPLVYEADYISGGNGFKNQIRIRISEFSCNAIKEESGLYGLCPRELFSLGSNDGKSFHLGTQLLTLFYKNHRKPQWVKMKSLRRTHE